MSPLFVRCTHVRKICQITCVFLDQLKWIWAVSIDFIFLSSLDDYNSIRNRSALRIVGGFSLGIGENAKIRKSNSIAEKTICNFNAIRHSPFQPLSSRWLPAYAHEWSLWEIENFIALALNASCSMSDIRYPVLFTLYPYLRIFYNKPKYVRQIHQHFMSDRGW